jgi:hypothetical protein
VTERPAPIEIKLCARAAASADFSSAAYTMPSFCIRARMSETRHARSFAAFRFDGAGTAAFPALSRRTFGKHSIASY